MPKSLHILLWAGLLTLGVLLVSCRKDGEATDAINAPSQSAIESMSYENKVFYRVPEVAQVKVTCGNATLLEDRVSINQLGAMLMAPLTNMKLVFDTETGQIVNMRMQ